MSLKARLNRLEKVAALLAAGQAEPTDPRAMGDEELMTAVREIVASDPQADWDGIMQELAAGDGAAWKPGDAWTEMLREARAAVGVVK